MSNHINNIERAERIKQEAREAAKRYPDIYDACPYPFGSEDGRIFVAEFLSCLSVMDATQEQKS